MHPQVLRPGGPVVYYSYCRIFLFTTAPAFVNSNQLPLLYIKLSFLDNFPFMKTTPAQRFAFVFLRQLLFIESQYICHRVFTT